MCRQMHYYYRQHVRRANAGILVTQRAILRILPRKSDTLHRQVKFDIAAWIVWGPQK